MLLYYRSLSILRLEAASADRWAIVGIGALKKDGDLA